MIYDLNTLLSELERWHEEPGIFLSREDVRQVIAVVLKLKEQLAAPNVGTQEEK